MPANPPRRAQDVPRLARGERFEVHPGTKGPLARAREHDGPDVGVLGQLVEGVVQRTSGGGIDGISDTLTVQAHHLDLAVALTDDRLIRLGPGHG